MVNDIIFFIVFTICVDVYLANSSSKGISAKKLKLDVFHKNEFNFTREILLISQR